MITPVLTKRSLELSEPLAHCHTVSSREEGRPHLSDSHIKLPLLQWLGAEVVPPDTRNVTEAVKGAFRDSERVLAKRINGSTSQIPQRSTNTDTLPSGPS